MILVDFTVNECPDLNRLYCSGSQPSLISHDSDTVPAAYSRFDTICPSFAFTIVSHTSQNEHLKAYLTKTHSIAFVRIYKNKKIRCGKKNVRCLWPLTQLRKKAFKSVRFPATCSAPLISHVSILQLRSLLREAQLGKELVISMWLLKKISLNMSNKIFYILKQKVQWLFAALQNYFILLFFF